MSFDDFIILEIGAGPDAGKRHPSAESSRLGRTASGTLSADEVLVATPSKLSIDELCEGRDNDERKGRSGRRA